MSIVPYYGGGLIQYLIGGLIFLILSIIFAIFSPLGIFFVIFSIIRGKTKNLTLRTVSFVFQIILASLTFVIGFLISLLFSVRGSSFYAYSSGWIMTLAVILGVGFVAAVEAGIIIWQSISLKKK